MASSWGSSWGASWGDSWGFADGPTPDPIIHPTGGEPAHKKTDEEEVILTVINSFLYMRGKDGRD